MPICLLSKYGGTVVSWAWWNKCNEKLLLKQILSFIRHLFSGESKPTFTTFWKSWNFFFWHPTFQIHVLVVGAYVDDQGGGGMDERVYGYIIFFFLPTHRHHMEEKRMFLHKWVLGFSKVKGNETLLVSHSIGKWLKTKG